MIVAYFAAQRSALSYAVGEWARVWPLHALIRSLGAYFVRRDSRNALYRQVLARYVRAATAAGVVQAVYPEGGLTRDGRLRPPKLGLINYMVAGFDPDGERDLVFVPVGINYDRVLEDRTLVRERDPTAAAPRSRTYIALKLLRFVSHQAALRLRGRWYRFGYACVNFGPPVSMPVVFQAPRDRFSRPRIGIPVRSGERLGSELLGAIASAVPVLPVSLVATVFVRHPERSMSELEVKAKGPVAHRRPGGEKRIRPHRPRGPRLCDHHGSADAGSPSLRRRDGRPLSGLPEESEMLRYYANSIEHFFRSGRGGDASG